jgi:hypothetical protein
VRILEIVGDPASAEIEAKVQPAFAARARSRALLSVAKRAVEIAIEKGEAAALAFLAGETAARRHPQADPPRHRSARDRGGVK